MKQRVNVIMVGIIILGIFCLTTKGAMAALYVDVGYTETLLQSGNWKYEFKVWNTSLTSGQDLYDLTFNIDPQKAGTVQTLPSGWEYFSGSGFIEAFSTIPGNASSGGTDIAPGTYSNNFVLEFNYHPESIGFTALLVNPKNPYEPIMDSGATTPMIPTPVPAAGWLLCSGLLGLMRIKRRNNT
ncbi:MAG: hypothetical protein ED859_17450 [Desulfuromonadales bacterium]|nr:MAG: hypothetical protein ED859_17450 [Desulfuromonadales bacterium]